MPFLPPNQQRQSTEVIIQLVINPSNTAIFPTDCKQNNLLSIAFSSFLSMHIRIQARYCSTRVTLDNNYRFVIYARYMQNTQGTVYDHSTMLNVTWRRFDQSPKQLVVCHTTTSTFRSRCQQTRHKQKQHKVHVISPTSLEHNTSYTVFHWTFLEVSLNSRFTCELCITQTTGKLFVF